MDDFERLVAEAHAHGIRVILDFVPNHSSDQHSWFVESRRSRTSPKRDWHIWHEPARAGGHLTTGCPSSAAAPGSSRPVLPPCLSEIAAGSELAKSKSDG